MKMLEKFLPDLDHLIIMLTTIRAVYHQFLTPNKLKSVSIEGTFDGCLNEVCRYVGDGVGSHISPSSPPLGHQFSQCSF